MSKIRFQVKERRRQAARVWHEHREALLDTIHEYDQLNYQIFHNLPVTDPVPRVKKKGV